MPVYKYKGLNVAGKKVKGIQDAETVRGLRMTLRKQGVFLTDATQQKTTEDTSDLKSKTRSPRIGKKVSSSELAIVTRQLATLLNAGVTMVESLTALVEQTESDYLKLVLSQVKQRVNEGSTLAHAIGEYPKVFPDLFCNMVNAGESSGALGVVLFRLADFTEGQARLRSKIIGSLTYPAIMIMIGLGILSILFIAVIPKITKIFEDLQATLPIPTRVLLGMSEFTSRYWWLLLLVIGASIYGLHYYIRKTDQGQRKWDQCKLTMPVFGEIVRMTCLARFARTLATLLASGVPLLNSLTIVRNIVNNSILASALDKARESITEGESIATPLRRSGEFPPLVIHMIAVGEKSGQLERMLENIANTYEYQAENRINALTSLLEPLMIVVMGGAVGFMVFSILMPILQLNEFAL